MKFVFTFLLYIALFSGSDRATGSGDPTQFDGPLTFDQCLDRVLSMNAHLTSARFQALAAEETIRHAKAWPEPGIGIAAENVAEEGSDDAWDSAEMVYGITASIEPFGARRARIREATAISSAAACDLETARLDLITETVRRFVDARLADDQLDLAVQAEELTKEMSDSAGRRAEAGRVSPMEADRAAAEYSLIAMERRRAERNRTAARDSLASLWNGSGADIPGLIDDAALHVSPPPDDTAVIPHIESNPDLKRWDAELDRHNAAVLAASSLTFPAIELGGSVRRQNATGDSAYEAGVTITLPFFSRGRSAVRAAALTRDASLADKQTARGEPETEARRLCSELRGLFAEISELRDITAPAAARVHEAVLEGFRQGKFGYLDSLEARRALIDSGNRRMNASAEYRKRLAELDRICGGRLGTMGFNRKETSYE